MDRAAQDSYSRLAFLGDSVLGARGHRAPVPAPGGRALRRGPPDEDPRPDGLAGRRAARSPSAWASPSACGRAAPDGVGQTARRWWRPSASWPSVIEAIIGACYLHAGYSDGRGRGRGLHARDRARARAPRRLQVHAPGAPGAARRGRPLRRHGRARAAARPHLRGPGLRRRAGVGTGPGRSKKHAEQEAARLDDVEPDGRDEAGRMGDDAPEVAHPQGLQVLPGPHELDFGRACRSSSGPTARASPTSPTPCCGRWASSRRSPSAASRCRTSSSAAAAACRRAPLPRSSSPRQRGRPVRPAGGRDLDPAARPLRRGRVRLNGARCRLVDVLEVLSDTGLGKELHSVVSQGRVEAIVTSKPSDRRLLIEEAAGLGKHRKRRRRAQLKLDRTQDNLDRALDVSARRTLAAVVAGVEQVGAGDAGCGRPLPGRAIG